MRDGPRPRRRYFVSHRLATKATLRFWQARTPRRRRGRRRRHSSVCTRGSTPGAATAARRSSTRACKAHARKNGLAGPRMELKPAQPTESMFRASWMTQQLDDSSDRSVHHPARCAPWSSASCVATAARSTACCAGDRASTEQRRGDEHVARRDARWHARRPDEPRVFAGLLARRRLRVGC